MNDHMRHDDDRTRSRRSHDDRERDDLPGRAVVARFESRCEAREAIGALHKAHFHKTWLGSTSIAQAPGGGEIATVESAGFFFGTQSLTDALVSRGVLGETARAQVRVVEPGNAFVTVDPSDGDHDEALAILRLTAVEVVPAATAPAPIRRWAVDRDAAARDAEWEEMLFQRR